MKEIWKDIENYEGLYQVSNLGRVKSLDRYVNHSKLNGNKALKKGKTLKTSRDRNGYQIISLSNKNIKETKKVSILVSKAFIPNLKNKPQVNHKDGNKQNDCINNLEWTTNKENMMHAFKMGLCNNKGLRKKVAQYDLDNNLIKIWESQKSAENELKITKGKISACCRKERKKTGGYKWSYYENIM